LELSHSKNYLRIRITKMNKEAYLEEVYRSAVNDEMDKLSGAAENKQRVSGALNLPLGAMSAYLGKTTLDTIAEGKKKFGNKFYNKTMKGVKNVTKYGLIPAAVAISGMGAAQLIAPSKTKNYIPGG